MNRKLIFERKKVREASSYHINFVFLFILVLICSCKKNSTEPVIIQNPVNGNDGTDTKPPTPPYFSFLKDGNEFTYVKTSVLEDGWNKTSDTLSSTSYTVKVSKSKVENFYELDTNLPELIPIQLYSDSNHIGLSPFDVIVPKEIHPEVYYNKKVVGLGQTSYRIKKTKIFFEGDSMNVWKIYYSDGGDPGLSGEIIISRDIGIISAFRSVYDYTPMLEAKDIYQLTGRNY